MPFPEPRIGRAAYTGFRRYVVVLALLVSQSRSLRNVDMLAWFSEDERQVCECCGEPSAVSIPDTPAAFCLRSAVTIEGVRLDVDGVITV